MKDVLPGSTAADLAAGSALRSYNTTSHWREKHTAWYSVTRRGWNPQCGERERETRRFLVFTLSSATLQNTEKLRNIVRIVLGIHCWTNRLQES